MTSDTGPKGRWNTEERYIDLKSSCRRKTNYNGNTVVTQGDGNSQFRCSVKYTGNRAARRVSDHSRPPAQHPVDFSTHTRRACACARPRQHTSPRHSACQQPLRVRGVRHLPGVCSTVAKMGVLPSSLKLQVRSLRFTHTRTRPDLEKER